jgi:uncharacterized protein
MANPLFDRVVPKEFAARGQLIECKGKMGDFERLVEFVEADIAAVSEDMRPQRWRAEPVDIRLQFGWADGPQGVPSLTGRASAQIPAVCQRCLEAFELSLEASLKMLLVEPGEWPDLAGYEVWELEEEALRLADIVEESLVMAMPLAPTHGSMESCAGLLVENIASGLETVRPFADLRSKMEKSNN